MYELHAATVWIDVVGCLMVRLSVTVESQPAALVPVQVAVLFDDVYVVPCQVYELHADTVSVELVGCFIVRLSVTVESHPAAFTPVQVAVLLDAV